MLARRAKYLSIAAARGSIRDLGGSGGSRPSARLSQHGGFESGSGASPCGSSSVTMTTSAFCTTINTIGRRLVTLTGAPK